MTEEQQRRLEQQQHEDDEDDFDEDAPDTSCDTPGRYGLGGAVAAQAGTGGTAQASAGEAGTDPDPADTGGATSSTQAGTAQAGSVQVRIQQAGADLRTLKRWQVHFPEDSEARGEAGTAEAAPMGAGTLFEPIPADQAHAFRLSASTSGRFHGPMRWGSHDEGGLVIQYGDSLAWCRPLDPPPDGWTNEPMHLRWTVSGYDLNGQLIQDYTPEEVDVLLNTPDDDMDEDDFVDEQDLVGPPVPLTHPGAAPAPASPE